MQNLPKKSSSIRVHGIEDEVLAMILRQFAELLFNRIDVNGDGVLSGSELKESFKQRKHELQAKERARKASYEKRVKPIRSAWKFTKYSAWLSWLKIRSILIYYLKDRCLQHQIRYRPYQS